MAKKKEVNVRPFGFYFTVDEAGYPTDWTIVENLDENIRRDNPDDYDYALTIEVPVVEVPKKPALTARLTLNPVKR